MSKTLTTKEFIRRSKKVHGNKYEYTRSKYKGTMLRIIITCKACNRDFLQTPNMHINGGNGCPKCGTNRNIKAQRKKYHGFLKEVKEIHGNEYDYSKVNYINAQSKIIIIHKKCGTKFLQKPDKHLSGQRCPKCFGSKLKTNKAFKKEAAKIHGNEYDYSKVNYVGAWVKVAITHKKCGCLFYQAPINHLSGRGCSRCVNKISTPEQEFLKHCKVYNTPKNRQVKIGRFKVDGFKITTNTVYEFLGDYWHGNHDKYNLKDIHPLIKKTYGQLYKETFLRLNKIKDMGYNVQYIWENDWNRFKNDDVDVPNIQKI